MIGVIVPITTVSSLARLLDASPPSSEACDGISSLAAPAEAGEGQVTVLFDERALDRYGGCRADLVVCSETCALPDSLDDRALRVADPGRAFVKLLQLFHPPAPVVEEVHPSAVVHPDSRIANGTFIGALVVVEAGARIGEACSLAAQVYVGPGVRLGRGCRIEAGARILEGSVLGDGVRIDSGSVIGSRGFGYLPPDDAGVRAAVPQTGGVVVGDGAHIGALCAIDRGTLGNTVIGAHARIDNLVQVAHNCAVGAGAVLVAQVGLSGSVTIGAGAVLAGQSGVADHRCVGEGAVLSARAAAFRDVPAGEVYGGFPARPHRQWLQDQAQLSRLRELRRTRTPTASHPPRQLDEDIDDC